jgi:hypothetical protein
MCAHEFHPHTAVKSPFGAINTMIHIGNATFRTASYTLTWEMRDVTVSIEPSEIFSINIAAQLPFGRSLLFLARYQSFTAARGVCLIFHR